MTGLKRVLCVDDDYQVRKIIAEALKREGIDVTTASNGANALQVFMSNPYHYHVVVSDFVMPLMNGEELRDRIRHFSPVPIILCTGSNLEGLGLDLGKFSAVIIKPFNLRLLCSEIKRYCA